MERNLHSCIVCVLRNDWYEQWHSFVGCVRLNNLYLYLQQPISYTKPAAYSFRKLLFVYSFDSKCPHFLVPLLCLQTFFETSASKINFVNWQISLTNQASQVIYHLQGRYHKVDITYKVGITSYISLTSQISQGRYHKLHITRQISPTSQISESRHHKLYITYRVDINYKLDITRQISQSRHHKLYITYKVDITYHQHNYF